MWTILLIVWVGGSQGSVSTSSIGKYENATVCTKIAAKLQNRWQLKHVSVSAECVQIKDGTETQKL